MEIKFTKSQSLAIQQALSARNARMKEAQALVNQAQAMSQEAAGDYDAALLEVLGEHGVEKIPDAKLEPTFVPAGAKRPDGIKWLDEAKPAAPPQGSAALDAAKKELEKKEPEGKLVKLPEPKKEQAPPAPPLAAATAEG